MRPGEEDWELVDGEDSQKKQRKRMEKPWTCHEKGLEKLTGSTFTGWWIRLLLVLDGIPFLENLHQERKTGERSQNSWKSTAESSINCRSWKYGRILTPKYRSKLIRLTRLTRQEQQRGLLTPSSRRGTTRNKWRSPGAYFI